MNGVIIGRFMPPHRGHQYLLEFAHNYVDELYVLVCTLSSEPIPGELRFQWMRELFPRDHIIHITEEIPEASRGAPNAEQIWAESVREAVNAPVDHVFASESYGYPLAQALGAQYVPVDPAREIFPVSASLIRQDPQNYWEFIPEPVRPYFTRRVAVLSDTEALRPAARLLAKHFDTVFVNDYARFAGTGEHLSGATVIGTDGERAGYPSGPRPLDPAELRRAQHAAEEALARHARRLLFCERSDASYEELSRYDMILVGAEKGAGPASGGAGRRVEETLQRLSEEGRAVVRFSEVSDASLELLTESVSGELLHP